MAGTSDDITVVCANCQLAGHTAGDCTEPSLAMRVASIDEAMKRLLLSGLKRRAIVVLLKDLTGLSGKTVGAVLDGLERMRTEYTTR